MSRQIEWLQVLDFSSKGVIMRRLVLLIMLFVPLIASAQEEQLRKIYDNYLQEPGFTTVQLSKEMLKQMGVKGNIETMTAISTEDKDLLVGFCDEVQQFLSEQQIEMSFVNDGKRVSIHRCEITAKGKRMTRIFIFTRSDSSAIFITLKGMDIKVENAIEMITTSK